MNAKETCSKGHPFDAENTYWRPSGGRDCRTCIRARSTAYQRRKKGAGVCVDCQRGMIPRKTWLKMEAAQRQSAADYDMAPAGTKTLCKRCHRRRTDAAKRLADTGTTATKHEQAKADRVEDLEWMATHGESLAGAARRIGITPASLETWLHYHKLPDLRAALVANNPRDHNAYRDGSNVTELSGASTPERRARDRELDRERRRKLRAQRRDGEVA